ncbi:TetR/AcrR family transcriptional regulator [Methylophilus aquaticus]|uniref:TetR/AcrR family transcriptional regulator n=1 Tax=Methylophilus aquaticus TaxID=1971610 RepID=A0ABT9JSF0_9PROT|nr:TetR/AcrR family transcriptional regulator [Methylophilus aquaticus]MDP8567487.1 TetR/AcrR family transcriptional regulator [Methylophilus aquaticus]
MNMREKILTIAGSLFDTRGIQASGVDTIIVEAGIAKATLYKHFPSKNQLIMAYLRDKSDKFYAWLNTQLASKKAESIEMLIMLCELVEQWITTPEFHGLPFHIASVEFPDPQHPINQYSVVLSAELQAYLSALAERAGAKDPQALGQQLTILFEGAALVERLTPHSGAATRAKHAAVTLIRNAT